MATINVDLGLIPDFEVIEIGDTVTPELLRKYPFDTIGIGDTLDPVWPIIVSTNDTVIVQSLGDAAKAHAALATDGIGIGSADQPGLSKIIQEVLGLEGVFAPETTYYRTMAEAASVRDRLVSGTAVSIADVMQLGTAVAARLGLRMRDGGGIGSDLSPATLYQRDVLDRVRARDLASYGMGGAIAETIAVSGTLQGDALFDRLLTDTVGVGDTITSAPLILQVVADETVEITAVDAVQMLYDGRLSDTVSLTAVYPSIDGSVTTWALNTKTGAVTEYSDYAFNSFARLDGRHIAASSEGLYELTGDTDDGQEIVAEMESALFQMSGSRFTSFRAAYLAVRGGGRFVLRLETGDGKTYDYDVTADDMATTKINLGKGLRSRYFSFTLISSGQDFDLEALEFVPIAARRHV